MGSRRNLLVVLVLVGSSTAGCLGDAELVGEESQGICVGSGCMPNSANINGMPVDELHLDGLANPSGMSFQHVKRANGDVMPLHVEGSRLYAIDTTQYYPQYLPLVAGDKLVVRDISAGEEHYLQILSSSWMSGWWHSDSVFMTYQIGYQDPNVPSGELIPICNQPPINDPSWTGFETTAVFFRGERYSEKDKTVTETGDQVRLWFNIACAGTALMKMYRMGYDPELPDTHTRYSKPEQRQITLKMITADYCGTGRSFTHSGEPMHWYNAPTWAPNLKLDPVNPPPTSNEAVWGEKGAICLDVPRLEEEYADPHELYKEIADECGGTLPPPCSISDLVHWASFTEWRTINGDN